MAEGTTIQDRMCHSRNNEDNSHVFARLMFRGKVKAALRMLMDNSRGSFPPLLGILQFVKKHPPPSSVVPNALVDPDGPLFASCHF